MARPPLLDQGGEDHKFKDPLPNSTTRASKDVFQRELNQPGVHRRRCYLAKSGKAVCSSRIAELRVIEQIEKLRPKLEPRVFMESANLRRFGQGCIEIELTRAENRPDSG